MRGLNRNIAGECFDANVARIRDQARTRVGRLESDPTVRELCCVIVKELNRHLFTNLVAGAWRFDGHTVDAAINWRSQHFYLGLRAIL